MKKLDVSGTGTVSINDFTSLVWHLAKEFREIIGIVCCLSHRIPSGHSRKVLNDLEIHGMGDKTPISKGLTITPIFTNHSYHIMLYHGMLSHHIIILSYHIILILHHIV